MTSSFPTAHSDEDALGGGVDTIFFSGGASDYTNASADIVPPPGDDIVSAVTSPWGEGEGLNGQILRPENAEQLIDILERIEFDATIYSDSHIRHSYLNASVNAYDQDGNYIFARNINALISILTNLLTTSHLMVTAR